MEQENVNLEVDPVTLAKILQACFQLASWSYQHRDEIKAMIKAGYTDAKAIVNYLKKKYGH